MSSKTVVYDGVFDGAEHSLHIHIDASKFYLHLDKYYTRLVAVRRLPTNFDNLSPADPVLQVALENNSWVLDSNERISRAMEDARRHYEALLEEAQRDAAVLAAMVKTPVMDFDPEPIPDDDDEELPGLEGESVLPRPSIDLSFPIERRLRQLQHVLVSNPSAAIGLEDAFKKATISFAMGYERDEVGFRAGKSDSGVHQEDGGVGVVRTKAATTPRKRSVRRGDGDPQRGNEQD